MTTVIEFQWPDDTDECRLMEEWFDELDIVEIQHTFTKKKITPWWSWTENFGDIWFSCQSMNRKWKLYRHHDHSDRNNSKINYLVEFDNDETAIIFVLKYGGKVMFCGNA